MHYFVELSAFVYHCTSCSSSSTFLSSLDSHFKSDIHVYCFGLDLQQRRRLYINIELSGHPFKMNNNKTMQGSPPETVLDIPSY